MRGKTPDNKFICNFLQNCAAEGKSSVEEIINFLNISLSEIDKKIIEAEDAKKIRPKLLDVKEFLNKKI